MDRRPETPSAADLHQEEAFQSQLSAALASRGLDPDLLVSTGPASVDELHAAQEALGSPVDHEAWLSALAASRASRGPSSPSAGPAPGGGRVKARGRVEPGPTQSGPCI